MSTTRTRYKLFPAANYFKAAVVRTKEDKPQESFIYVSAGIQAPDEAKHRDPAFTYTISSMRQLYDSSCMEIGVVNDNGVFLLPNGYYFKNTFYRTISNYGKPNQTESEEKKRVDISNYLSNDTMSETVDDFIDTGSAAIIKDIPGEHVVCGVNHARSQLFTYTLTPSQATVVDVMFHRGHAKDTYELGRQDDNRETIGDVIFTAPADKQIASFAGFPGLSIPTLAVAFANGEIITGNITDKKFSNQQTLVPPAEDVTHMQLLSAPQGILISYTKETGLLRFWDLSGALQPKSITLPCLANLNVSASGNYLTALDIRAGEETNMVHCFDLKTFEDNVIKLDKPVTDFVIGHQDKVVMLANQQRAMPGHIETLLNPAPEKKKTNGSKLQSFFAKFKKHEDDKTKEKKVHFKL